MVFNRKILIVLIMVLVNYAFASNKAVFIHGFGSDSKTWLEKNTPQELLQLDVIDDTLMFDYSFGPGEDPDVIATNLILEIMSRNSSGDKWIIIGHSLGGLVARAAEYEISNNSYGIDLVGIITIGTPHQGAGAADVLSNNAQTIVDTWHYDASEGPETGPCPLVIIGYNALANLGLLDDEVWQVNLLPSYLDSVKVEAEDWIGLAQENNADELLVPLSDMIQELNSGTTIAPHRSIIGSERSPTIMRWSSEFYSFFQDNYDEIETMELYDGIIQWYSVNVDAWDGLVDYFQFTCDRWYLRLFNWSACDDMNTSISKRDKWQLGVAAWQNIDNTWSQAIGCNRTYSQTTEIWHPAYTDCSGQIFTQSAIRDGTFDFETLFDIPPGCFWVPGWMETTTVVVNVAQKNDGLIQTNLAKWSSNQNLNDAINPYYDDISQDGGWNHSEMMRYTRIYDGEDTGTPAADIVTPLKDNRPWILQNFGN